MSNYTSVNKKLSSRLSIIDQGIYDEFQQGLKKNVTHKIVKHRKSRNVYSLNEFIKPAKHKKQAKKTVFSIYKKRNISAKKNKCRHSKLKKCILKYRILKKSSQAPETLPNPKEPDDLNFAESFKTLSLEERAPNTKIHSRRFREYCDNTTSTELNALLETLLRQLNHFQIRAFQTNQYRGRSRRRIVIGFREVQTHMVNNKLKCVVIATDCEICDLQGGLDELVMNIKECCQKKRIPYAFALQRRELSYALHKKTPISCVGVLDYDGAQEVFLRFLTQLEREKSNYKRLIKSE